MKCAATALALAAFAGAASAQLTAYNDQGAWEADLLSMGFTPVTETFDGVNHPDMQPGGGPYDVNDFSITVEGQMDDPGTAEISGGDFHGEIFPDSGHSAYVHSFDTPVVAFGQFYEGAASGLGIRIETTEGVIDIFDDGGYSGFDDGFFGFISEDPVTDVRIIGSDADGGTAVGEIYDAQDASYAFIPSPSSVALLGLGGLLAARRRR